MNTISSNKDLFTTMPVGKAVFKLALPTVISQIIVILYSMADTFFIGRMGDPNQLAALSIAFPIFTLLTATVTETNSGVSQTIKFRPIASVNSISLSPYTIGM